MTSTIESEWGAGNFHRDTLIYSLSRMVEVVLVAAFRDEHFCHHLAEWRARWHEEHERDRERFGQPNQQTSPPLLCLGINGARLTVVARDSENEFLVRCTHEAFSTLLAVAYYPHPGRLVASCVVQFDGESSKAVVCANALLDQLRPQGINQPPDTGVPDQDPQFTTKQAPSCRETKSDFNLN